ncbi:MAG: PqqD family protein [Planctomycetes bacterium]|nr:PqqD family protein [Planctomycetota bacterium]
MKLSIPAHVALQPLGEETVLLNTLSEQYHSLDEVGSRILGFIREEGERERVLRRLVQVYPEESTERLEADFGRFLEGLEMRGLIVLED